MIGNRCSSAGEVVEHGLVLLHILSVLQDVVDPSDQTIWPLKVESLFVFATVKAGVAAIAVRQSERLRIVGQRSTQAHWCRAPNFIDDVA